MEDFVGRVEYKRTNRFGREILEVNCFFLMEATRDKTWVERFIVSKLDGKNEIFRDALNQRLICALDLKLFSADRFL